MKHVVCLLLLGILAAGCRTRPDVAACTERLLETDREFARHSVEKGPVDAFASYLTESGMQLPNGAPPIFGRSEIVEAMADGPEFGLDWDPQHAEASASCDLGWTWGTYEATFSDSAGATIVSTGKYVNVWRRMDDGSWRVVLDAGNHSGLPPQRLLRTAAGNVLESVAFPAARIELDSSFQYVGRYDFKIDGVANGERFVFVDAREDSVEQLFVAHFEAIVPESDEVFRYSFEDAMELAGFRFRQNVWSYRTSEAKAEKPDGEAAKLAQLLESEGYRIGDELVTSRYVMVPDEARKHEMILFYVEPAPESSYRLEDLAPGLHERAVASFSVTPR